jgi:hypothetical protein
LTLQQLEAHREDVLTHRRNARRAALQGRYNFTRQDDVIEGTRSVLNSCYLHRATGGEGYGFAALRAWAKRNAALMRARRGAEFAMRLAP